MNEIIGNHPKSAYQRLGIQLHPEATIESVFQSKGCASG